MVNLSRGVKARFGNGDLVLCFEPDVDKARVLYPAKVTTVILRRDEQTGQRAPAYSVHFQGWKDKWDREVGEEMLLEDNEFNRRLMSKLSKVAKRTRNRDVLTSRIAEILMDPVENVEQDDVSSEASSYSSTSSTSNSTANDDSEIHMKYTVDILESFPDSLRSELDADHHYVSVCGNCYELPVASSKSIRTKLEDYFIYFKACTQSFTDTVLYNHTPPTPGRDNNLHQEYRRTDHCEYICREVLEGLTVLFDFTMQSQLLYAPEKQQINEIVSTSENYPSVFCGRPHLLRLLVNWPSVCDKLKLSRSPSRSILSRHIYMLLRFLEKQSNDSLLVQENKLKRKKTMPEVVSRRRSNKNV